MGVGILLLWRFLYDGESGLINAGLRMVGLDGPDWLTNYYWAKPAIMFMGLWAGIGGTNMILYLAGLQNIPREVYEAAVIDGASGAQQFRHITIPMIRPTIIFTVIISTIGGLQLFTEPFLFQPLKQAGTGGSDRQYQTVAMYLYEKAFGGSEFKFGYASAIAWSLFLLIVFISAVNFLLVRRIRSAD